MKKINKFEVKLVSTYYSKSGYYYEITNCWFSKVKKEGLDYNPIQANEYFYDEKRRNLY